MANHWTREAEKWKQGEGERREGAELLKQKQPKFEIINEKPRILNFGFSNFVSKSKNRIFNRNTS